MNDCNLIGYKKTHHFDAIMVFVDKLDDEMYTEIMPNKRNPNSRYVAYIEDPHLPETISYYDSDYWFNWTMSQYGKSDLKTSPGSFKAKSSHEVRSMKKNLN